MTRPPPFNTSARRSRLRRALSQALALIMREFAESDLREHQELAVRQRLRRGVGPMAAAAGRWTVVAPVPGSLMLVVEDSELRSSSGARYFARSATSLAVTGTSSGCSCYRSWSRECDSAPRRNECFLALPANLPA